MGFFALFFEGKRATSRRQSTANMQSHCQPSTGDAYDVEYTENEGLTWWRRWDPDRQWYAWRLVDSDGSLLGPVVWRAPWELNLGRGDGGGG